VSARGGARPARRRLLAAAVGALLALPLVVALTDAHLDGQSAALVLSTAAAALAVVLVHLGALYVESPEDTLFALSLDGPTRGRMAALATAALIAVVALGVLRARLPMAGATWRILHGFLAALVIFLGFGHAVLTDGALDELGTPLLLGFGALALLGVGGAYAARRRRARS
jgi:predicted ferric reductase